MNIKLKEVIKAQTVTKTPTIKEKYLAIGIGMKGDVWTGVGSSAPLANEELAAAVYDDTLISTKTFEISL